MYWDYNWYVVAACWGIVGLVRVVEYFKNKEKKRLAFGLLCLLTAAATLLNGYANLNMKARDAEYKLRAKRWDAKHQLTKVEASSRSPEAVATFVADLHDGKLAEPLARAQKSIASPGKIMCRSARIWRMS